MANIFVSTTGNDGNTGTISNPFLTITRAMNSALSGDIVYLREGTYREQIVAYGTPANVTIEGYQSEEVNLSAFDVISSFTQEGSLYTKIIDPAQHPGTGKFLVLVNGSPLKQAQWPYLGSEEYAGFGGACIATTGSSNGSSGTYTCSNLPATIPVGSKINFCPGGGWGWQTGVVISRSGDTINFSFNPASEFGDACLPSDGDKFFLWGHSGITDIVQPGTYCLDDSGSQIKLYLRLLNDANPNNGLIEIKTRKSLMNAWDSVNSVWGKQGYQFRNINFLGAPPVMGDASNNCVFDSCLFSLIGFSWDISQHSAPDNYYEDQFVLAGNYHSVTNCHFSKFGSGVILVGEDITFSNNIVEYMNICGFNKSAIGIGSSSILSKNIEVSHNNIKYTGRSGIGIYNTEKFKILDNVVSFYNILTKDNGGIYFIGTNPSVNYDDCKGGEVSNNIVFKDLSPSYPAALYFDHGMGSNSLPVVVHHNIFAIFVDGGAAMRLHAPSAKVKIYNNNLIAYGNNTIGLSLWGNNGEYSEIEVKNNIITSPIKAWMPNGYTNLDIKDYVGNGLTVANNIYHDIDPLFAGNPLNLDFSLQANSPAINAGTTISPYTDGFVGLAPDCGAIETNVVNFVNVTWEQISNKPIEFPPSSHSHSWNEITDKPVIPSGSGSLTVDWLEVTNKPTEFPSIAHEHDWLEVTNKPTEFPSIAHEHDWLEVTNKPTEFPSIAHGHDWLEVTNKPTEFPAIAHGHDWLEVTNKPTEFPAIAHGHDWLEVTNKPTEFQPIAHGHDVIDQRLASVEGDIATIKTLLTQVKSIIAQYLP